MMDERIIYSSKQSQQLSTLLSNLMISLVLDPAKDLIIDSPWIQDLDLIDNRGNEYVWIFPEHERKRISLIEILYRLAQYGTKIIIHTKPDNNNNVFVDRFRAKISSEFPNCKIILNATTHSKGIVCDNFFLGGSMNITYSGVHIAREQVRLTAEKSAIAAHLLELSEK
jgi:hypothetical protein